MLLVKIALYIFAFFFIMYLAHRALWLIFFLFNFRFWEMVMLKYANGFFESLEPSHRIIFLIFVSVISYLMIYFTTMKMPLIRYVLLGVMFILAIRTYDISDIFMFKDYFEKSGMWGMDYWSKEIRGVFSLKEGDIFGMFQDVCNVFVKFFLNLFDSVKKL